MKKIILRLFWRKHEKKIMKSIKHYDRQYQSLFVREDPLFTSPRNGNKIQFLIDGQNALREIAEQMIQSTQTIYITDWRMDLDIIMVREQNHPLNNMTLLDILKIKAREGIQIKIILYLSPFFMDVTKNQFNHFSEKIKETNIVVEYLRWNVAFSYHQKSIIIDHSIGFIGGIDLAHGRWDNCNHYLNSSVEENGIELFKNDCYNSMITHWKINNYINDNDKEENNCKENKIRLPWHDIHCKIEGPSVFDIERNFIELWNNKTSSGNTIETRLKHHLIPKSKGNEIVQIVRSICEKSGGNNSKHERGCYEAMLRIINSAEHYIYIEQQYFITNYGGNRIWNIIGMIISEKIIKAFKERRKFKVVLVIPIFSEGDGDSKVVKSLMYLMKKSIYKGKSSIYQRLKNAGIVNIEEYFIVLTLYKFEKIVNTSTIIGSPIYIHSKCIIVDDKYVYIGSSNINDRSLRGDRDSEIGALIASNTSNSQNSNRKCNKTSPLVKSFRMNLWNEHLGIYSTHSKETKHLNEIEELNDNPIETIEEIILPIAEQNTIIYERNFLFFPSNKYRHFMNKYKHLYPLFQGDIDELNNIKGHFIKFPLYFGELEKQSLSIGNIIVE